MSELARRDEPGLVPSETVQTSGIDALLQKAVERDIDIDKLERLLAMKERHDAERSRSAFAAAMAACQRELPAVLRDAENTHTRSRYARLETIAQRAAPIYTRHGFSLSFGTAESQLQGHLRVTCECTHAAGHAQSYHLDCPYDSAGSQGKVNKTPIQAMGSTISYARRYITLMTFNIVLTDEDNDGAGDTPPPPDECITEEQAADLRSLIEEVGGTESKICEWGKVGSLEELPLRALPKAIAILERKRAGV